ncbi:MAG: bifunctional methylenetetrahydrofolate dehydrogenase/methenyltetrahydrofolate cyclohydrolase FolD [Pirellulales bacterium]
MAARILDGKQIADQLQREMTDEVAEFFQNNAFTPKLAAILVGNDPASEVYVRNKQRACERVGIESELVRLPATVQSDDLLETIARLNRDEDTHGILVQLPLPKHIESQRILDAVSPWKDVDCFHPDNVGRLMQGRPRFLPCTPHGVLQILHRSQLPVAGKHVVVVGRSDIVGKPLAMMLAQRSSHLGSDYANATVTLCHSQTPDLARWTQTADILVAAVGQPKMIRGDMVRPGTIVIDVGINRVDKSIVGDVDFAEVSQVASAITPVPGGVGPLTVTMLLRNTLTAAALNA